MGDSRRSGCLWTTQGAIRPNPGTLDLMPADLNALWAVPLFSTQQARAEGISPTDLRTLVRRGQLIRVGRGWYTARTEQRPEELHVLRTVVAVWQHEGRAVASHHSAVLLHGLPLAWTDLDTVVLSRTTTSHGRTRDGVRICERRVVASGPVPVAELDVAIPSVPLTLAVAQTLTRSPHGGLVAADAAVREGRMTRAELSATLESLKGVTGIAAARDLVAFVDGRHESPGETLTGVRLRQLGFAYTPQVEITAEGHRYRVDALLDEHPVILEFDGASKYGEALDLVAEKVREDRLRRLGYEVVRITWDDLADPGELLRRICEAVARAHPRSA